ncbi:hypothetical protein AB0478_42140 [Streptomyces sp. NPDC051917]|uniref:hypothetical protein n=1 Tax=Streptomyces sp. NPDC051917 TaxID=3154754 RepID=UPI003454BEB5
MAIHPGFGVLLTRLLNHRRMDVTWLASASGISERELRSMVSGVPPPASQLDDLAPALGFHADDLYVIADVPASEARIPWDPAAGSDPESRALSRSRWHCRRTTEPASTGWSISCRTNPETLRPFRGGPMTSKRLRLTQWKALERPGASSPGTGQP